ncbi:MAG TPA: hypothetical protein PLV68_14095, partial [Ilumatobacteraceae bacterium]|nr:hypothetical protein [Ilumatobacteraceae bacterium]
MSEKTFGVRLQANVTSFVQGIERAERETKKFSENAGANFERVGSKVQSMGSKATRMLTVPILAAG